MHEHQASVERRQPIVDDDLLPLAEHPEAETENAAVAFRRREALAFRYDPLHQVRIIAET